MKHVALARRLPLEPAPAPPRPRPRSVPRHSPSAPPRIASAAPSAESGAWPASGIYPSPFGFVLGVPVGDGEQLVPVAASSAAALAPIATALGLVRSAGGFELERVALPTAEARLRFVGVPDLARAKHRVAVLARDLLALATTSLPARHRLGFRPALELRSSGASTLCLSLYGDGPVAPDEREMLGLARALLPALTRLVEADAGLCSEALVRRRIRVGCRVPLDALMARLGARRRPHAGREREALLRALEWFSAARVSSALAAAQNDIVLGPVADVARALGQNAQHAQAEGLRHASRFGSVAPLARFELEGSALAASLQLACGRERPARRHDAPSELAHRLLLGRSVEDVALLSACVGLAAALSSLKAAVSLALSGALQSRSPAAAAPQRPVAEWRTSNAPDTDETHVMSRRPWAVLENPRRLRTRSTTRVCSFSEETRVMPLARQHALERALRPSEPRSRSTEPPRRAPPLRRAVPGRERR